MATFTGADSDETHNPTTADYWIGPMIGQGAFSQVHYAKHKWTDRLVAIKVMDQATLKKQPQLLGSVLQERKFLFQLRDDAPYVVNLWSSFYDSQCVYLVMELCAGGDLQQLIQRYTTTGSEGGAADVEQTAKWMASIPHYLWQVAHAIKHLHSEHQLIHCDLKPANVLLDSKGTVRLADFASGLALNSEGLASNMVDIPRGTTEFSPPELIQGLPDIDTKSPGSLSLLKAIDYWSFGCLVIAMYTGRSPFHRQGSEALSIEAIRAHVDNNHESSTMFHGYDIEFDSPVITRALHEWEHTLEGLLQGRASKRVEAWEQLATTTTELTGILLPERPKDFLLPTPDWRENVDSSTLRDGSIGWSIFFL